MDRWPMQCSSRLTAAFGEHLRACEDRITAALNGRFDVVVRRSGHHSGTSSDHVALLGIGWSQQG
jgi:hypothetical protein